MRSFAQVRKYRICVLNLKLCESFTVVRAVKVLPSHRAIKS